MDDGLAIGGVLLGVLLGVEEVLSTLAFLDPERGVMLELKNALTGVARPPLVSVALAWMLPACTSFRNTGAVVDAGDLTLHGVCGPLPATRGAVVDVVGEGLAFGVVLVGRSKVMTATLQRRSEAVDTPRYRASLLWNKAVNFAMSSIFNNVDFIECTILALATLARHGHPRMTASILTLWPQHGFLLQVPEKSRVLNSCIDEPRVSLLKDRGVIDYRCIDANQYQSSWPSDTSL